MAVTRIGVGCAVALALWVAIGGVAYALKVTPSASTVSITEGQSHLVTFSLDEPIIAQTPNPDVELNFTIDDPSRVSLSTGTLTWPFNEWFQTRDLTVNALEDGVHDDTNTVVVHYTATSASEYYNGFSGSFTVMLTDIDAAPSTTTSTTLAATTTSGAPTTSAVVAPSSTTPKAGTAPAVLPNTGSTSNTAGFGGALLVISGATALGFANRRRD